MEVSIGEVRATAARSDEYDDILALLLDHKSGGSDEGESLAREIAGACLGDNHLWQDMGLPDRQRLSDLLEEHFHALFVKNVANMKWKKFFYKQLCERMEVSACRAPSCRVCKDYDNCFGPEVIGARPM
ncbi:MAG: nitrogen fixation protein NifQ [Burkholderiales bacterium]|nr:nitrogen fixation protein NifQ [Burkholderiales bacterium]